MSGKTSKKICGELIQPNGSFKQVECSFCKTVGKILPKDRNYFVRSMSHEVKNSFFKKNSPQLIQIILWIRKFRFWSSHWKFFGERPKLFRSLSEKNEILKNLLLNKIYIYNKTFYSCETKTVQKVPLDI